MAENKMPVGKPMGPFPVSDPIGFFNYELENFFGFCEATVFCPPNLDPPLLPYRTREGNILFPTGLFRGFFFSEELKKAKSLGYVITVHKTIKFNSGTKLFSDFILETYQKRVNSPKKSPTKENFFIKKFSNLFFKLIMLSIYGRFALNPVHESVVLTDSNKRFQQLLKRDDYLSHSSFNTCDGTHTYIVRTAAKLSLADSTQKGSPFLSAFKAKGLKIAPHISAAIASYVRLDLYNILKEKDNLGITYCDTDSVFCESTLPESEVDSTQLGKWKFEACYELGVFLGKKLYKLWSGVPQPITQIDQRSATDPNIVDSLKNSTSNKVGFKGAGSNYTNQISEEEWISMLNMHPVNFSLLGSIKNNALKMKRDFSMGQITLEPTNLTVTNMSVDKSRQRIGTSDGLSLYTRPLIINNEKTIRKFFYKKIFFSEENYKKIYNSVFAKYC